MKYRFLKANFLIYLCTFTLPVFLLGALLLFGIYIGEQKKIQYELKNSLKLAEGLVQEYESDTEAFHMFLGSAQRMAQFILVFRNEKVDYDSVNALRFLSAYMTSLQNSRTDMESVYFYLNNASRRVVTSEKFTESADGMKDNGWLDILLEMKNGEAKAVVRPASKDASGKGVFSVLRCFPSYKGGTVINYRLEEQQEKLKRMAFYDEQEILIFDRDGQILFGSTNAAAEAIRTLEDLNNLRRFYVVEKERKKSDFFHVVTVVSQKSVNHVFMVNMRTLIFLSIVTTIASAFLAYDRAVRDYRQLYHVIDIFERAEKKQELITRKKSGNGIYDQILNNIIRTFLENSYLQVQLSEQKYRQMTAQMLALQYQINPHFLFNTLQALNYEILALTGGKQGNANRMVENLSDILRYSLDVSKMDVSIQEEIDICKKYMDIQKMRTAQDWIVEWEVSSLVKRQKIRRMLLQPLLENALSHGIKNRENGRIRIVIGKRDDKICVKVLDNGKGIPKDKLMQLREKMREPQVEFESEHIGLQNVNYRLALAYGGENMGLHIASKEGMGTMQYFYMYYLEEEENR